MKSRLHQSDAMDSIEADQQSRDILDSILADQLCCNEDRDLVIAPKETSVSSNNDISQTQPQAPVFRLFTRSNAKSIQLEPDVVEYKTKRRLKLWYSKKEERELVQRCTEVAVGADWVLEQSRIAWTQRPSKLTEVTSKGCLKDYGDRRRTRRGGQRRRAKSSISNYQLINKRNY